MFLYDEALLSNYISRSYQKQNITTKLTRKRAKQNSLTKNKIIVFFFFKLKRINIFL